MATTTIRKFVNFLNNPEEQGGFWLPNIQRPFVWKEDQIERLYDSILREYPIGTLLVWKTKSNIKTRKFIDNYKKSISLSDFYIPQNENQKMMILDGQQRVQSLYIGLKGSYSKKELYFNIISGDLTEPEDIKYEFKFIEKNKADFPFIRFKDLVMTDERVRVVFEEIINKYDVPDDKKDRIHDNIELVREVFCTQENIIYNLVDSVDRPKAYTEDDVVEIFIRANSGGTKLGKSDLLFSLLTASWAEAEENIDELINELNKTGYAFDRDFILKTSLVLLNKGAKYEINKFRDPSVKENIENNWVKISEAIKYVKDYVYDKTFMKTDKTLPSYLSLIPLIYSKYHFSGDWDDSKGYGEYLLKVNLTGVFGGVSDNFTDSLINSIKENKDFILSHIFGEIRKKGKNMELQEDTILSLNYNSKEIHMLLNLWYGFNYQACVKDNKPQIDHIFPQSHLKKIKDINPETGMKNIVKYKSKDRDQIANLMLLTAEENGASGKRDILPKVWFANKDDSYLEKHLIPKNKDLWEIDRFEDFLSERKKLIINKFGNIITSKSE